MGTSLPLAKTVVLKCLSVIQILSEYYRYVAVWSVLRLLYTVLWITIRKTGLMWSRTFCNGMLTCAWKPKTLMLGRIDWVDQPNRFQEEVGQMGCLTLGLCTDSQLLCGCVCVWLIDLCEPVLFAFLFVLYLFPFYSDKNNISKTNNCLLMQSISCRNTFTILLLLTKRVQPAGRWRWSPREKAFRSRWTEQAQMTHVQPPRAHSAYRLFQTSLFIHSALLRFLLLCPVKRASVLPSLPSHAELLWMLKKQQ